jgi:Zn-dependent metalloprotease
MAYYWISEAQLYIQSLGFGSTRPAVNRRPVPVRINQYGGDNSFFRDDKTDITYGKGGVDDAEDAEVVVHEYGHSVQNAQVPGFGTTPDSGAIGEGFSDYLAVEVSNWVTRSLGVTTRVTDACVADWDSTSYDTRADDGLYCLRRVDGTKHYPEDLNPRREVHADGELWSAALYRLRNLLADPATADTIVIGAQFDFTADTTFDAAARATYAYAQRYFPTKAAKVRQAFVERGFTVPA